MLHKKMNAYIGKMDKGIKKMNFDSDGTVSYTDRMECEISRMNYDTRGMEHDFIKSDCFLFF
ncbi:MAG TPA: hypothetical protein PKA90_10800 [Ignavibacteria bacterium]|nr:hypothetical protein [Ignavibacteria bacterium]HMR40905.1 hypothetical protein [Ignavibacteria bacterium]